MLSHKLSRTFNRKLLHYSLSAFSNSARSTHELTTQAESCQYPAIFDNSTEGRNRYERQIWYDSIKAMPTLEEKLHEIAVQQREDIKKYVISSVPPSYNGVYFYRYITRTHLIQELPDSLMKMNVEHEFSEVSDALKEVLSNYYCNPWTDYTSNQGRGGSNLVNNLISKCFQKMGLKNEHLRNSTIHTQPRINSFWWHGGFKSEEGLIHEQNLAFNYDDKPAFMIRMQKPLNPVLSLNDPLCATAEVDDYNYQPELLSFQSKEDRHLSSLPGYWPNGDDYSFPLLIVNTSDQMIPLLNIVERFDLPQIEDSLSVMSCFGCLNAFATQQGFTPFHDVTYPFVAQSILTNGQDWTFYVYQLNTIALHSDVDKKDRRNICWSSGKLRLFETIENGQVKGINDEVFKILLRFVLNTPTDLEGVDLQPYLGEERRDIEVINSTRYFLRRMYTQAPDPRAHNKEVYMWQKIYKFHKDAPPSPYIKMK